MRMMKAMNATKTRHRMSHVLLALPGTGVERHDDREVQRLGHQGARIQTPVHADRE